jgi:hypothetical protein
VDRLERSDTSGAVIEDRFAKPILDLALGCRAAFGIARVEHGEQAVG